MPSLSFFADKRDAALLLNRLNTDSEMAYIVSDGPLDPVEALVRRLVAAAAGQSTAFYDHVPHDGYRQRWKAVRVVDHLKDGKHSLWHIPAGCFQRVTGFDVIFCKVMVLTNLTRMSNPPCVVSSQVRPLKVSFGWLR